MEEDPSAPLSLYVGFTSLPTSQLAVLLGAMSNIYSLVADERDTPVGILELGYVPLDFLEYMRKDQDSELCLDFARTGNSIEFRFSGRRTEAAAKRSNPGKGKLRLILATVGAIIALAGQGQVVYDRHADATMQREIEKNFSIAEIDKINAETEEIRQRMNHKPTHAGVLTHHERRHKAIAKNVKIIQQIINAPNITVVTVNGVTLKQEAPAAGNHPDADEPDAPPEHGPRA
jgi:hypothetical protein